MMATAGIFLKKLNPWHSVHGVINEKLKAPVPLLVTHHEVSAHDLDIREVVAERKLANVYRSLFSSCSMVLCTKPHELRKMAPSN